MKKHNPVNERIKHKYLRFLKESKGQNESSIDSVAMALKRFEKYTKYRDFKKFHYEQAIGFKKYLADQNNLQSGEKLSKSTLNTMLRHLKGFFQWLSMQTGYKSRITFTDTEYFNLSEKDTRIANASRERPSPTLDQVKHTISMMPSVSVIERRNRALIAFALLSGARDSAIASMKLKHVSLEDGSVFQDAKEVKTKFSKTFTTFFLPVGDDVQQIFSDWVAFLRQELHWGDDDPLFPKTEVTSGRNQLFEATGLLREHWSTASPIREIFRNAFKAADLPYFNPHSIRNTLVKLSMRLCHSPEEFKAWSQNIGHNRVLTTLMSYGEVAMDRQGELIRGLSLEKGSKQVETEQLARELLRKLQNT